MTTTPSPHISLPRPNQPTPTFILLLHLPLPTSPSPTSLTPSFLFLLVRPSYLFKVLASPVIPHPVSPFPSTHPPLFLLFLLPSLLSNLTALSYPLSSPSSVFALLPLLFIITLLSPLHPFTCTLFHLLCPLFLYISTRPCPFCILSLPLLPYLTLYLVFFHPVLPSFLS